MTEQQEINQLNRDLFKLDVAFREAAQQGEKRRLLIEMSAIEAKLMELYGSSAYGLVNHQP